MKRCNVSLTVVVRFNDLRWTPTQIAEELQKHIEHFAANVEAIVGVGIDAVEIWETEETPS